MDFLPIKDILFKMEKQQSYQYMYNDGKFYFRFMIPNIPPSSWIELTEEIMFTRMQHQCQIELNKLYKKLEKDWNEPCANLLKLALVYQENRKDIVNYYSRSNYSQYAKDLYTEMYFSDNCIVLNPGMM